MGFKIKQKICFGKWFTFHMNIMGIWYESVLIQDLLSSGTLSNGADKGSVHGACRVSSHTWHVGFQTRTHSPVWNVCVIVTHSFACAPRWRVALVGFIFIGR